MINYQTMSDILVKRLNNTAKLPTKAHPGDAGWDLYSNADKTIKPQGRSLIPIGCSFAIPEGYYGRIADRSGNAWKAGIHVMGGVIDSKYRGEVKVVLINHGFEDFHIETGDKIAQMVITKIHEEEMVEVDNLDDTKRNKGGFGSTGK